jgi:hypothetical protein
MGWPAAKAGEVSVSAEGVTPDGAAGGCSGLAAQAVRKKSKTAIGINAFIVASWKNYTCRPQVSPKTFLLQSNACSGMIGACVAKRRQLPHNPKPPNPTRRRAAIASPL